MYLAAMTELMHQRPCPEGFSLAKSPQEQTFTTNQVIILDAVPNLMVEYINKGFVLDRSHPYLRSHTRGTQADSGQVGSLVNGPIRLVHYPWQFVSPQLLDSEGEQINNTGHQFISIVSTSRARTRWSVNAAGRR